MILKHRDRELLRFEWLEPRGVRVLSVNEAEKKFLPLEMHGEATDKTLWEWLRHRIVPKHRNYILDMLGRLGIAYEVRSIIETSQALSLNDVYWVASDRSNATWAKTNLYVNPFSPTLARLAFTGGESHGVISSTSPEFTTNGMLAKCWRKKSDGRIYLYKSGTEHFANAGFEPYSEFYAAQIADALGLEHVPYGLEKFKGRLCSTCPLFTNDKVGFVPAGRIRSTEEALQDTNFAKLFFFDAIILNTDRHLGNFGYLINNDTNEIIGAAPIFDNGYGLLALALDRQSDPKHHEWDDLTKYTGHISPALYPRWLGFPGGISTEMKSLAMKLKGFRFKRHENYNLPERRLSKLEEFLQNRLSAIIEFGEKADDLLKISTKSGGEPRLEFGGHEDSLSVQILESMSADPFVSQQELSELLSTPVRTIQRQIVMLKREGKIKLVGSGRTKRWEVIK